MPHSFSRSAFEAGRFSPNTLLSLYCSLVVIELSLKDSQVPWRRGHSIGQWLTELADAGLTSLTQQLSTRMQVLSCTAVNGSSSWVKIDSYPDVRYLLHESDGGAGTSTDQNISDCLALIRDIETVLDQQGIR